MRCLKLEEGLPEAHEPEIWVVPIKVIGVVHG